MFSTGGFGCGCTRRAARSTKCPATICWRTICTPISTAAAWLRDPKGALFRTIARGRGALTTTPLPQANAYAMIGRRAAGRRHRNQDRQSHFPRHRHHRLPQERRRARNRRGDGEPRSTRTTQLYDRRSDQVSLDEIERVRI